MRTAVRGHDSRLSPAVPCRSLSRALHELRVAVGEIAAGDPDGSATAAVRLVEVLDQLDGAASAQELLFLFLVVDRARDAARKAPSPARYDWKAWSEVSQLAGRCIVIAVRAMRSNMAVRHASAVSAALDVANGGGVAP